MDQMNPDPEMQQRIEACQQCHNICLRMALTDCLRAGGKHVEEEHFRLMINCAEICQTAANFMLSASALHGVVCQACAKICSACADSCEQVGDMDDCVQACRRCAETCEAMAGNSRSATGSPRSRSMSSHANA